LRDDCGVLADRIRDASLLRCRAAYYVASIVLTIAAFAGGWVVLFAVGDSWASLGIAALFAGCGLDNVDGRVRTRSRGHADSVD
jgi:hypothetical protein